MIAGAYAWEIRKLLHQWRTYLGLGAVVIVPLAFVVAYQVNPPKPGGEQDLIVQDYVLRSGFILPLIVLFYSSLVLLPAAAALVAGDIFAAEDQNRTLKTILTRSTGRGAIFAAKVLATATYVLTVVLAFAATGLVAGGLAYGFDAVPLPPTAIPPGEAALRVAGAFGLYALPLLAITALGLMLSAVGKNSAGAVFGTLTFAFLVQFVRFLPGLPSWLLTWTLTKPFDAWQTLIGRPIDTDAATRAVGVSAVYVVVTLAIAWRHFTRRDVIG
ncbi:MAG: type transport system permease protein [Thermomicrobiales bacterium]|jgi:ABC-2 type transport system permease protein|nr:type transport system permease protein [Thermomicrobiales bacterium]